MLTGVAWTQTAFACVKQLKCAGAIVTVPSLLCHKGDVPFSQLQGQQDINSFHFF